MSESRRTWQDLILPWATFFSMLAAIFMVFLLVPSERDQGIVQRIFCST